MTAVLDARKLGEKKEAHQYMKRVFGFPEYYGHNLDALNDCISEINNLHIIILHRDEGGEYFERVLSVLEEAAEVSFL